MQPRNGLLAWRGVGGFLFLNSGLGNFQPASIFTALQQSVEGRCLTDSPGFKEVREVKLPKYWILLWKNNVWEEKGALSYRSCEASKNGIKDGRCV